MHNCDCFGNGRPAGSFLFTSKDAKAINSCGAANRNSARWLADLRDRVRPTTLPKLHIPRPIMDCAAKSEQNYTIPLAHGQRRNGKQRRADSLPISSGRNAQGRVLYFLLTCPVDSPVPAESQEQPAYAGFFLLALSTGANLVSSTTQGTRNEHQTKPNARNAI